MHTYFAQYLFIPKFWHQKNVFCKKIAYSLYYDETLFRSKMKRDNWFKIEVIECKEVRFKYDGNIL